MEGVDGVAAYESSDAIHAGFHSYTDEVVDVIEYGSPTAIGYHRAS